MLPQPKSASYHDGFNTFLFAAVPPDARRLLDVGCAGGRLAHELKQQDPDRHVIGVEIDAAAATQARIRLDQVFEVDIEEVDPPVPAGSLDCIILGDVLEHLREPELVLRRLRSLLTPQGSVVVSLPNVQHAAVLKALVRGDFMYQPEGLLDATHLRFFTAASFTKLMLDAGFLPRILQQIRSGTAAEDVDRATPLLQLHGVDPDAALESFDTFQYIFSGTVLDFPEQPFADTPISFVVCSNDRDQLESNLRRSPCLDPGTPHELIVLREQPSAAAGYEQGREQATNDLVVFVHQDVYLPRGWDARFVEQFLEAERRFGPIGVAGVYGYAVDDDGASTPVGRVIDRQTLYDVATPLPAPVTGLDEIVLAFRRMSPVHFDPALGFHLYGADLALQAATRGLGVVALDAPCFHNSLFHALPTAFHDARRRLLAKWPDVRPLHASMGRLDGMAEHPSPPTWYDDFREFSKRLADADERAASLRAQLRTTAAELEDRRRHIENMEASVFWRARNRVHRLLRRG